MHPCGVSLPEGCAAVVLRWGPSHFRSMASAVPALSCPIRFLCIHRYAPGVPKGGTSPYELQWLGKRGKPVKKMRLIPAERAHAIARKLQGTPGVSVSVL